MGLERQTVGSALPVYVSRGGVNYLRHSGAFLEPISASCEGRRQRRRPSLIDASNTYVYMYQFFTWRSPSAPAGDCRLAVAQKERGHIYMHTYSKWCSSFGVSWGRHQAAVNTEARSCRYKLAHMNVCVCIVISAWLNRLNVETPLLASRRKTHSSSSALVPLGPLALQRRLFTTTLFVLVCAVGSPTSLSEVHYESIGYQP